MNKIFSIISLIVFFLCVSCKAQKDSLSKTYYSNGKMASIGKKIDGLRQGEWKYFDDSTGYVKKIITFKDNFYHGIYKEYYKNNSLKIIGYYDRNFVKEEIDENGNISAFAIPIGSWDFYDENGNLIKTEVHDCSGKIIKVLPEK